VSRAVATTWELAGCVARALQKIDDDTLAIGRVGRVGRVEYVVEVGA